MTELNMALQAINPKTGEKLEGVFRDDSEETIKKKISLAHAAFQDYSKKSDSERAIFLMVVAEELKLDKERIIQRCILETALPEKRLDGEFQRTINQIVLFSEVLKEGSWQDLRIDLGNEERKPLPKPDVRHMLIPIGPVAVFGASNFPLAFSVAGGDTISALAAGCPVVFKAHPAHPGTSEMVAACIDRAILKTGMHKGVFALINGVSNKVGGMMVKHPLIKAVGFTGSYAGGKALLDIANNREEPIPVFAEMGSTNPVFVLPDIIRNKGGEIAEGLANSITMGVGQFCTNPGMTFVIRSKVSDSFIEKLNESIRNSVCGSMLTSGIKNAYIKDLSKIKEKTGVKLIAEGVGDGTNLSVSATVFKAPAQLLLKDSTLAHENFGPSSVVMEAETYKELIMVSNQLNGHLTATVFGTDKDLENHIELVRLLENKVGRLIINDFPTGVEVCHSMVHGGPFPATTVMQSTSVGSNAIKRFVRPICYQGYPQHLLPQELKDENPMKLWRLVDGNFSNRPI